MKKEKKKKKIAIDTFYTSDNAYTVGVIFSKWTDREPLEIIRSQIVPPFPYVPGQFYKRELPCILDLLKGITLSEFDTILIDGYIWLRDNSGEILEGLGSHLWDALPKTSGLSLVGVAKSKFGKSEEISAPIIRGTGITPLYVQAVGKLGNREAGELVRGMYGANKLPYLLHLLDEETKKSAP